MGIHADPALAALRRSVRPEVLEYLDFLKARVHAETYRCALRIGLTPGEAEAATRAIITSAIKTMAQHVRRVENRELVQRLARGTGPFS